MNDTIPADELLAVPDACKAVHVCRRSLYHLMNAGSLRAVKIGRRTFVRRAEIARFLKELPEYPSQAAA